MTRKPKKGAAPVLVFRNVHPRPAPLPALSERTRREADSLQDKLERLWTVEPEALHQFHALADAYLGHVVARRI